MKVVQINATCGVGSTGKICTAIAELLNEQGIDNYILYSVPANGHEKGAACYSSRIDTKLAAISAHMAGNWGFEGRRATEKLLKELDCIQPDLIHLHNLHSHACHLEMLFDWVKQHGVKVIWTFHDCWPFTGLCTHYDNIGCTAWKEGCQSCPVKRDYSLFTDKSRSNYLRKKKAVEGVDLLIVTPSKWMAEQVRRSFFSGYRVSVIYNGINLEIFHRQESTFREEYGLSKKKIVLGVASPWSKKKGIDVFCRLATLLDSDYQIILIGTDSEIEKHLPVGILPIRRTEDQAELAKIYSAADVFVNPTREETLGLVNIEALACGTPVITFDVGGSPETVCETCGSIVEKDNISELKSEIERVCTQLPYKSSDCIERSRLFDERMRFREYVELYRRISIE